MTICVGSSRNRMAVCLFVLGTLVWSRSPISAQDGARLTSMSAQTGPNVSNVIDTYCSSCHNGRMRSPSGILLDPLLSSAKSTECSPTIAPKPSSRASSSRGCSSINSATPIRTRSTFLITTSPCAIPSPKKPSCSCSVNCVTTATLSNSGVQTPSQLLSAWLCAGELRSAGPLAHSRPGWPGRRFGRVRGWHVDQRSGRTPAGPAAALRGIAIPQESRAQKALCV